jgi:hypothetical protein
MMQSMGEDSPKLTGASHLHRTTILERYFNIKGQSFGKEEEIPKISIG